MAYENYTKTSQNFDLTRRPIGVEILLGCFATLGRPLSELVVLDAGCGTGSYSLELLPHIGRIEGVDVNVAMFERARRKAAAHRISPDRFLLHEARIEQLPFTEGHFDAVMVNQVLHHLDDDGADGFPRHRAALNEFARVMRPDGVYRAASEFGCRHWASATEHLAIIAAGELECRIPVRIPGRT